MPNRREILRGAAALPLALSGTAFSLTAARAQEFPTKTVVVVAPFPQGGVADYAARPLATFLTEKFGRPVVVENRPGAGGGVGHAYVARAEPDGYTIMVALPSLAVIPEANRLQGKPVNYETTDFVPIARLLADPVILVVRKDAKWKTIHELIDDVKANPGKITYGSSGQFATVHLANEMFLKAAGLNMLHIPYQGGAPAVTAFMAGQVEVLPTVVSNIKGHLDSGLARPLVQFGDARMSTMPDIPTLEDIGYKGTIYILWSGVFAPAKTPEYAQKKLRAAIADFMSREDVLDRFRKNGTQIGYLDGPEFAKFLEADNARLIEVTRNVKLS